ncbi:alpha/beta fold hydrolase [Streptomyces sp. NBC_01618]|uniref:alpha/beta fold hydrolase n=1 Tax=Streptomyces sp. NBC_01618 TaxID=2975900 RepID=UPI00386D5BCE|nr:alpha/beta fold hydrolase [Streptomyces sp. NBC_01618]
MTVLHVRDHGGPDDGGPDDGRPALLLLHAASRSLADWDAVAPHLTTGHRVLAVDLPGHGRSAAASWSFDAVLRDLDETLAALGVAGGVVPVGHSLGGMVAALYAAERPDRVPGAVNLDGFWWGTPTQYPGLDPDEVTRRLADIGDMARASAGQRMPAEYVEQQAAYSTGLGIPYERAEASFRASVRELPDGGWQLLPERECALEMLDALDALDLFALFRRVPCPLLLVRALHRVPPTPGLEWLDELMGAYGHGLARDLAVLVAEREGVTAEGIGATHAMLLEVPEQVAELVREFVSRL